MRAATLHCNLPLSLIPGAPSLLYSSLSHTAIPHAVQDPSPQLAAAGWRQLQADSRAQIAARLCGGGRSAEGLVDFEWRQGEGRDRYAVFVVAEKA